MKRYILNVFAMMGILFVVYVLFILCIGFSIRAGLTNAESKESTITQTGEQTYHLPDDVINAPCVQFILKGITKRKAFNKAVIETTNHLGLDYNIVMSAILGEQIRISCKGVRGSLKSIIMNSTPTLFRSFNVSLGIAGLKVETAHQIRRDAIKNGYGDGIKNIAVSEDILSNNDRTSGIYATYLVQNIIFRRWKAGYDISKNPGVIGTLYNIGNRKDKEPNADPKLGGSVITINGKEFVYGEISLGVFNYLTKK